MMINHLAEIDETLWIILKPEKRDLSLDLLQREFRYPNADRMFSEYYRRRAAKGSVS
jgi:hypothetical protein